MGKAQSTSYVARHLPKEGRGTWRDKDFRGLECVGRSDKGAWYLRHTIDGNRFRVRLGDFPETTPAKARELAQTKLGAVNAKVAATDKTAVARELRQQQAQRRNRAEAPTLGDAIDFYADIRLAGTRSKDKTVKAMKRLFAKYLHMRPDALPPEAVRLWIEKERVRAPSSINTTLRRSKPLFRWMFEQGWTTQDILAPLKVKVEKERNVSPTKEQVAQILIALEGEESASARGFVTALIYTAQRRANVAQMQAGEIDVENRVWIIPAEKAKTDEDYKTPLSETALEHIQAAAEAIGVDLNGDPDAYVFQGKRNGPYGGFGAIKQRLDDALGADFLDWTFHDLRHAFSDGTIKAGSDVAIVDRCLNHSASATTSRLQRRYQRDQQVERQRAVFETWASLLADALAEARGEVPANCPSSNDLEHERLIGLGGSGSP